MFESKKSNVRKSYILLFIILIFMSIFFTNAYADTISSKDVNSAKQLIKNYKMKLYNISDYQKLKAEQPYKFVTHLRKDFTEYFTAKGIQTFMNNRVPFMYGEALINSKGTLKLKGITFSKIEVDINNKAIVIEYTANYMFYSGGKPAYLKDDGQIIVKKQNNRLLIDNDYINVPKEFMALSMKK